MDQRDCPQSRHRTTVTPSLPWNKETVPSQPLRTNCDAPPASAERNRPRFAPVIDRNTLPLLCAKEPPTELASCSHLLVLYLIADLKLLRMPTHVAMAM